MLDGWRGIVLRRFFLQWNEHQAPDDRYWYAVGEFLAADSTDRRDGSGFDDGLRAATIRLMIAADKATGDEAESDGGGLFLKISTFREMETAHEAIGEELDRRNSPRLALDDVVNLEDLWFAGKLDSGVGQYGHQPLTERLELLPRVPDFADTQVPFRPEANVVIEVRPEETQLQPPQAAGVLSSYFSVVRDVGLKRTTMLMTRSSMLGVEPTLSGIARRSAVLS